MDLSIFVEYGPRLLAGFRLTILCWLLGTVFGAALGLLIAVAQRYGGRVVRRLLQAYVELIRGTPFLVQLFLLYYGGPMIGLRLDPLPAGLLGLTIYGSPYFSEIFRSAFRAVPNGLIEAGRAIGMSEMAIVRRILLPVGLVSALPALVNFSIILTKETVILSIVTVPELMYQTQYMATMTFTFLEGYFTLALFFWAFVEVISRLGRRLERRLTRHLMERT